MTNPISFMTANYVARESGYHVTEGWGQGQTAVENHFRPPETFAARFEVYLKDVRALGFDYYDLWLGILSPVWATAEQIEAVRRLTTQYQLRIVSLAGGFGDTVAAVETTCKMAATLGVRILGGNAGLMKTDRASLVALLKQYDLVLGIENHPEKNSEELLAKIGDGADGRIGAAVDTGWFGTHGYDVAKALQEIGPHLVHLHLKDVLAPGGHDTCRFGLGCVPIQRCVEVVKQIGYTGALSVEHEPYTYDPTADVAASYAMLKEWLK